jgi:gas vesicle protein GvpL/GvpF
MPRETSGSGWYVYGVVPAPAASDELFAGVRGVDAAGPVVLVADGELAAITSAVPLAEFEEVALERNLRDEAWLEQKVRAHEAVLEAALARVPLVPFRFGTIYRGDEHVRRMLRDNAYLGDSLERLAGAVELGVKAFLDPAAFERSHAEEPDDEPAQGGRAYLLRKQRDRRLSEARASFAASCARDSHERLAAAAEDGRANPLRRPALSDGEMILNAAYLVRTGRDASFAAAVDDLRSTYEREGVRFEVTGPWPPYNFVDAEPAR